MKTNLSDIKERVLANGINGKYVHSDKMTIGHITIKKDAILPSHSHPNEQITQILAGRLQMEIDGLTEILETGDIRIIPSNAIHSAVALADCEVIDTFYPSREDYK